MVESRRSMLSWLNDFVSETESPWSVIQKYLFINALTYNELKREIKLKNIKSEGWTQYKILVDTSLNIESFNQLSGFDFNKHQQSIFKQMKLEYFTANNLNSLIKMKFRFCPRCMETGFHSIYHQMSCYDTCVYHTCKLLSECPKCKLEIGQVNQQNIINNYKCLCGHMFIKDEPVNRTLNNWKSHTVKFKVTEPIMDFHQTKYFLSDYDSFFSLKSRLKNQININANDQLTDDLYTEKDLRQVYKAVIRHFSSFCTCDNKINLCNNCKAIYKLRIEIEQEQRDWINTRYNRFYNQNKTPFSSNSKEIFELNKFLKELFKTENLNEKAITNLKAHMIYYLLKNKYNYWLRYLKTGKNNLYMPFICSIQRKNLNVLELIHYEISSSNV